MINRMVIVLILIGLNPSLLAQVKADTLIVTLAGDLMIGSWGLDEIEKNGIEYPVKQLQPLFRQSHFNMCNLEAPFTTSNEQFPDKSFNFKVHPKLAEILTLLPVHYVTLANNHIMDFGDQGLMETIQILDKLGISHSGAGENEQAAICPAIANVDGKKIGVIACGAIFPQEFWATDTSAGVFFPWKEKLVAALQRVRPQVDYLMVTFHWGAEKRPTPKQYQEGLAKLCINNGADLVWGHHPHVIQGVELIQGKPVIYSLGNFIFASFSETASGMVVQVMFVDNKAAQIRVIPLDINNFKMPLQPSLMSGPERNCFIERLNSLNDSLKTAPVHFDQSGIWKNVP